MYIPENYLYSCFMHEVKQFLFRNFDMKDTSEAHLISWALRSIYTDLKVF